MDIEQIAKATHEMNRMFCEFLGDNSQPPWDHAPPWQRESSIAGVEAVLDGSATTPAEQHQLWMERKFDEGWSLGPKKDPDRKRHPCLVPYEGLPASQRAKDEIFRAVVKGLT